MTIHVIHWFQRSVLWYRAIYHCPFGNIDGQVFKIVEMCTSYYCSQKSTSLFALSLMLDMFMLDQFVLGNVVYRKVYTLHMIPGIEYWNRTKLLFLQCLYTTLLSCKGNIYESDFLNRGTWNLTNFSVRLYVDIHVYVNTFCTHAHMHPPITTYMPIYTHV